MVKKLREKYKNLPRLGFPTTNDNLILETNALDNPWCAILKTNQENICECTSRTFKFVEKNYHSNEK